MTSPCSAYVQVGGLVYFARMLGKIRLMAAGKLAPDYHKNLGRGFDGRCCRLLKVAYPDVQKRTLEGGTDEEILEECFERGYRPDDEEILIWNAFMMKRGWRDEDSELLNRRKVEGGFGDCTELQTLFDLLDMDEGRAK
jgi:gluconokinase